MNSNRPGWRKSFSSGRPCRPGLRRSSRCGGSRNNAITEGFHTKMEVLQRRAYGFRNFQNYRMRVKVLCS
ncbi:MAG: transposase [Acidobacteriia bacterium]|nr:transposase [Terriglobia bacterium]